MELGEEAVATVVGEEIVDLLMVPMRLLHCLTVMARWTAETEAATTSQLWWKAQASTRAMAAAWLQEATGLPPPVRILLSKITWEMTGERLRGFGGGYASPTLAPAAFPVVLPVDARFPSATRFPGFEEGLLSTARFPALPSATARFSRRQLELGRTAGRRCGV